MEFLKKHYEKFILCIVLLGLAGAAGYLPFKVTNERESLQNASRVYFGGKIAELPPLNLTTNYEVLARLANPTRLPLAKPGHNVFSPIKWTRKTADGPPIPDSNTGLSALMVTNIIPLHLVIAYEGTRDAGENLRYLFRVTREAATNSAYRRPLLRPAAMGAKVDSLFVVREVKGNKESPDEVVVEVLDSRVQASVSTNKPYIEVAGYAADLRHEPENRTFLRQMQGQTISLAGVTYNIVAISRSDVTLEDKKTKKRTNVHWKAAPGQ